MADNIHKFRTVKHGDPDRKLKMLPQPRRNALTTLSFVALTVLCAAVACGLVYAALP